MSEIRELRFADTAAVANLCGQLGYPATPEQVVRRLARLLAEPSHAAFVAVEEGEVAGWLHVFLAPNLESDLFAEIGGLVVADAWRSRRIGARLVAHARAWAAERGVTTLRVRSRTEREAAHRFYRREGFVEAKRQAVFVREGE